MIKQCFFVIILLSAINSAFAQKYMKANYFQYTDQVIIEKMMHDMGIIKYFVYQTMLQKDSIVLGEDENKINSFLIWPEKNNICIKLFSKDHIYKTETIKSIDFLKYRYFNLLWADEKESNFKFIPPNLEPFNSELILYVNGKMKCFFELGILHYYTENVNKLKYRKEFIYKIKNMVFSKLKYFKIDKENIRKSMGSN